MRRGPTRHVQTLPGTGKPKSTSRKAFRLLVCQGADSRACAKQTTPHDATAVGRRPAAAKPQICKPTPRRATKSENLRALTLPQNIYAELIPEKNCSCITK